MQNLVIEKRKNQEAVYFDKRYDHWVLSLGWDFEVAEVAVFVELLIPCWLELFQLGSDYWCW